MAKRNPLENIKPVSGFSPNLDDLKRQLGLLEGEEVDESTTAPSEKPDSAETEVADSVANDAEEAEIKSVQEEDETVSPKKSRAARKRPKRKTPVRRKKKVTEPELDLRDEEVEEKEEEMLLYSIGDVAQQTDLETHVLRYWESQFEQLQPVKDSSGKRMYREQDVELVTYIRYLLKDAKFTIDGARQVLEQHPAQKKTDRAVWVELRHFLSELRDRLPEA